MCLVDLVSSPVWWEVATNIIQDGVKQDEKC